MSDVTDPVGVMSDFISLITHHLSLITYPIRRNVILKHAMRFYMERHNMPKCPNCGVQNSPQNQFCDDCGAELTGQGNVRSRKQHQRSKEAAPRAYLTVKALTIPSLILG
jgi:ribosomal protein L34E